MDFGCVEANLRESFRLLACHRESGEVRELPGLTIASAGVTFQMFNAAFLSAPVATESELQQRITQAEVLFRARGLPWAFWLCESWLPPKLLRRSRQVFRTRGLRLSTELPGMVAEELLPPARPLPDVEVRRVTDIRTREVFCGIGAVCFNVPLPWFREVFDTDAVWDRFAGYVGYVAGEPVSTAAIVVGDAVAGVYNVATLPGHQRMGYGEALMRDALRRTREEQGITHTILQSTPQGFLLYQRMGYRTVTRVVVYSS